jgi:hypothetical protein
VGANGDIVPVWGRRRQTITFASQDFEFDFFLAAVATPIIGMDFLTKFELSIIPAKQQVLHAASGRTLTQTMHGSCSVAGAAQGSGPPACRHTLPGLPAAGGRGGPPRTLRPRATS